MFVARAAFAISAALLATGCVVPSLQPLVDARSAVEEPRLLGRWKTQDNPAVYDIRRGEAGSYRVVATDDSGQRAEYSLRCALIAGRRVIDLFPLARGGYQSWDFLPLHSAFVADFTDSGLQLSALKPGWLDAHTSGQPGAATPLRLVASLDSSVPVFTGSTEDLQALYEEQLGNPEAFHEFAALTRLPEMAQLREITRSLVAAQMAYYAKNGSYAGRLAELSQPESYISKAVASGVPLPGSRIALKSGNAEGFQLFVFDSTGRGYRANETGVIINLLEEDALQTARTVAAAQFAYYAANGHYACSLQDLVQPERYLDDATAGGTLASGITVSLDADGQSFSVSVRLPDGQTYLVDQTGAVRPQAPAAADGESSRAPGEP